MTGGWQHRTSICMLTRRNEAKSKVKPEGFATGVYTVSGEDPSLPLFVPLGQRLRFYEHARHKRERDERDAEPHTGLRRAGVRLAHDLLRLGWQLGDGGERLRDELDELLPMKRVGEGRLTRKWRGGCVMRVRTSSTSRRPSSFSRSDRRRMLCMSVMLKETPAREPRERKR